LLDATTPDHTFEWNSILGPSGMTKDVKTKYRVSFADVDGTERPLELQSPEETFVADVVEVKPRELYGVTHIPVVPINFPWDRYPKVEVELRYEDPDNKIQMQDNIILDQTTTEYVWKIFVLDPQKTRFSYRTILRAADLKDVELPWTETDEELVRLLDPYPSKRTLDIVTTSGMWTELDRVFVDVLYEDPENNVRVEKSFEFSETDPAPSKVFTADLINTELRRLSYDVTLIYKDGRSVKVPTSFTSDKRLLITPGMLGHRVVTVEPAAVDFAAKNLTEIKAELVFADVEGGIRMADTFSIKAKGDKFEFEYDYVDNARSAYVYRLTYAYANGLSRSPQWGAPTDDRSGYPEGCQTPEWNRADDDRLTIPVD
jgi:hypothetical protein